MVKKFYFLTFFLPIIVFSITFSATSGQADPSISQSKKDHNIRVKILEPEEKFKVGQNINVKVKIKNTGSKKLRVKNPGLRTIKVFKEAKQKGLPKGVMERTTYEGGYGYSRLDPGEIISTSVPVMSSPGEIDEIWPPGEHVIQVSYMGKYSNKVTITVEEFPGWEEKYKRWRNYQYEGLKRKEFEVLRNYVENYKFSEDPISYQMYGKYLQQAIVAGRKKNETKIMRIINRAIENFGKKGKLLRLKANLLQKQGKIKKAIKLYAKSYKERGVDLYEEGVIRNENKFREKNKLPTLVELGKYLIKKTNGTLKKISIAALAFAYERKGEVRKAIEIMRSTKHSEEIIKEWRKKHGLKKK